MQTLDKINKLWLANNKKEVVKLKAFADNFVFDITSAPELHRIFIEETERFWYMSYFKINKQMFIKNVFV